MPATPDQLIRLHAVVPMAQASMRAYGVPASVTLAQWIVESSWGSSELAQKANNCFGVKSTHLGAPETYIEMPTAEYESGRRVVVQASFCRYASVSVSFASHAGLLARAVRYQPAMASAADPFAFTRKLQACGYSTNPHYADQLCVLIRQYRLTQYDTMPQAQESLA